MNSVFFKSKILTYWGSLLPEERKVLKSIINIVDADLPIKEISDKLEISVEEIVDISRKIGYDSFQELLFDLKKDKQNHSETLEEQLIDKIYGNYFSQLEVFKSTKYDFEKLKNLCNEMNSLNVDYYFYGLGSNKYVLNDFAYRLSTLGIQLNILQSQDELKSLSWTSKKQKKLVTISMRGSTREITELAPMLKTINNTKLVLITSNKDAQLIKDNLVDEVFIVSPPINPGVLGNVSGMISIQTFFDLLVQIYIELFFDDIFEDWQKVMEYIEKK